MRHDHPIVSLDPVQTSFEAEQIDNCSFLPKNLGDGLKLIKKL